MHDKKVIMTVDPTTNGYNYIVVLNKMIIRYGTSGIQGILQTQKELDVSDTYMDVGYNTSEMVDLCRKYGWFGVKGKMIQSGTSHVIVYDPHSPSPIDPYDRYADCIRMAKCIL